MFDFSLLIPMIKLLIYFTSYCMEAQKGKILRVFLADIVDKQTSKHILDDRLRELENLVNTYGGIVLLQEYQKRDLPDPKTYIGKGKLEEIIEEMLRLDANLLII